MHCIKGVPFIAKLIGIGGIATVAVVVAKFKLPETDNEFIMFFLSIGLLVGAGILLKKGLHR